jgi:3-hydroxybutyrate dehydrogenase
MIAYAEREFGGVDILVNNAGIQHVAPVEEFPVERWDSIIAINLSSVFHSTRLSLPGMRAKGWGRIINIASVHGLVGSVGKAAYVAAKHGVIGLTKVVAWKPPPPNHLQRHLPRLGADTAGAEADR